MAGILPGDPSHHGIVETSPYRFSHDETDEDNSTGASWYLSRKEIEENSPSRTDGIDLKKEAYFRKSYCTFLQDLGMRLKVPQVTIATAIVFCHRFFLRQSHAKNDRRTIATVCMFLAGKVEETPRPLKDVILVSYEIIHKKDPAAIQRIKQREVYEQQKELILLGERVVLATLGFDFNVHHPYKPLVEAIKKFKVAQNALAQVAWNFVNDGLRTSLCLQFKPHHIAAGAIFLAAKFLKVKLPSDGDKVWWQEFDVTPRQLEEVSNQMLELYEQNRAMAPSHGNETEGSSASGANHRPPPKALPAVDEPPSQSGPRQPSATSGLQHGTQIGSSSRSALDQLHGDKQNGPQRFNQTESSNDPGNRDLINEQPSEEPDGTTTQTRDPKNYTPLGALKIDKDKVKAAIEKRRKERGEVARKLDVVDDDDLIERELESGIELAAEDEKQKQEKRPSWSKPQKKEHGIENGEVGTLKESENEEGEFHSPEHGSRKRKAASDGYDHSHYHGLPLKHRDADDARAMGRLEREHKRVRQENHV